MRFYLPRVLSVTLTLTTQGIGFTEQNSVKFLKILTFHMLFQELQNLYYACWYLFKCISHGDAKYCNEIQQFLHVFQICKLFDLSSALACHVESVQDVL